MSPVQRPIRLQVMVTPEELKAIDDWRFGKRFPNRAAAFRELVRLGMIAPDPEEDTVQ